jgi:hypothetical protein
MGLHTQPSSRVDGLWITLRLQEWALFVGPFGCCAYVENGVANSGLLPRGQRFFRPLFM